jgi:hypothetical protein
VAGFASAAFFPPTPDFGKILLPDVSLALDTDDLAQAHGCVSVDRQFIFPISIREN